MKQCFKHIRYAISLHLKRIKNSQVRSNSDACDLCWNLKRQHEFQVPTCWTRDFPPSLTVGFLSSCLYITIDILKFCQKFQETHTIFCKGKVSILQSGVFWTHHVSPSPCPWYCHFVHYHWRSPKASTMRHACKIVWLGWSFPVDAMYLCD